MKNNKDLINEITTNNYSLSSAMELILKSYKKKYTLRLFYEEFEYFVNSEYNNLLIDLTNEEVAKFIEDYQEYDFPLPKINLSKEEYNHVKHFIRNINGFEVLYNVTGVGNENNDYKEVVYLHDALLNGVATKRNEFSRAMFLNNLKEEVKKYLNEDENPLKNSTTFSELPPVEKVFFVHYQCQDFNEGEKIYSLNIFENGKAKEYLGNEVESIEKYANKVNELLYNGYILVHWKQDRPNFGTDHINKRYKDLTGLNLGLEYKKDINLAEWLTNNYGANYIPHPRLDNLAKLIESYGIREKEIGKKTFATNRLLLLKKIYTKALNNNFKSEISDWTKNNTKEKININPIISLKSFSELLIELDQFPENHCDYKDLIDNVKKSFNNDFIKDCEYYILSKLYFNDEPNILFISELERILNETKNLIESVESNFKRYPNVIIEKYGREFTLHRYFTIAITYFKDLYSFGILRIKEANNLLTQKNNIQNNNQPKLIETIKKQKSTKTIFDYLHNLNDKENFLNDLKKTFPTEKGKSIREIINILVEKDILIYGTREFKHFHNELKIYFEREIGTYQSINDVKTNDKIISDIINKKLNPLVIKYKTT